MATNRGDSGGASRVLSKLKASVEAGQYYEAHQMYRTLYFRYMARKSYPDLLELLYNGALDLLTRKQTGSGADLSSLMVDVLVKSNTPANEIYLERTSRLYELISPDVPERAAYLSSALKWSSRGSHEYRYGHPRLHQLIAIILWKEKNYQQSWFHFLRTMDGEGCATMLVEYHTKHGYASEADLFIAQAVLQYLCLQNKMTATVVFFRYTESHPDINKGPPFLLPLLNFLRFLLLTVESGKLAAFTVLCEQYQPSIQRDPAYSEYLDRIGQLFFGLPPPRPKQSNMFGRLIQTFIGGLDDDDGDEDGEEGTSGATTSRTFAAAAGPSRSLKTEELD